MIHSDQNRIHFGLGLAVLVLILATAISYLSSSGLTERSEWVSHTRQVLEKIEALSSALKDAETSQRGYLITGEERFLEPYQAALVEIDPLVQNLRTLTTDNSNQQRRLDRLEPLIAQKRQTLGELIDLRKDQGFEAALRSIPIHRGKDETDAIRGTIAEMKQEEDALLASREERVRNQARITALALWINALLGLMIFGWVFYLLHRERTDRRRAQEELSEQTELLKSVLSSIGEGVVVAGLDGKFVSWNPAAEKIIQLGKIDVSKERWSARYGVFLPDQVTPYPPDQLPLAWAIRGESVDDDEQFLRNERAPEGMWLSVTGRPLRDASWALRGGVVVFRDVTERRREEEALRRKDAFLDSIVENVPNMLFVKEAKELRFVRFNKAGEVLLGYSREELIGKNDYDFFPKEQADAFTEKDRQVLNAGYLVDIPEEPIQTRYGLRILHTRKIPLYDADGQPLYLLGISEDITERKQRERDLHLTQERFRLMVEGVRDYAIFMLDPEGRVASWNEGARRIKGYQADEIIGQHHSRFYPPEDIQRGKPDNLLKTAAAEGRIEDEGWRVRKDGSRFWADVVITAIQDASGNLYGFSKVTRDLTERKLAEEEKNKLNTQLEVAIKELEAFSYSVSHDLRAPLRHINGFIELLNEHQGARLDEKGQHYLSTIANASRRMGSLIDDLLVFSRMAKTEMRIGRVDFDRLVQEVMEDFQAELAGREVVWKVGSLPAVEGDSAMLRQVWANLIGNAVKYTRTRKRAVIEIVGRSEEKERVFFVRDNGVGFDPQYAGKLFGVFQRLHRADEFEGTGIGLANVRRIVYRHGGRTWAESQLDQGAVFYFSLPKREEGEKG